MTRWRPGALRGRDTAHTEPCATSPLRPFKQREYCSRSTPRGIEADAMLPVPHGIRQGPQPDEGVVGALRIVELIGQPRWRTVGCRSGNPGAMHKSHRRCHRAVDDRNRSGLTARGFDKREVVVRNAGRLPASKQAIGQPHEGITVSSPRAPPLMRASVSPPSGERAAASCLMATSAVVHESTGMPGQAARERFDGSGVGLSRIRTGRSRKSLSIRGIPISADIQAVRETGRGR